MKDSIARYMDLIGQRPELFTQSDKIPLVLDEAEIRAFAEAAQRPMGLVYDNSPFYLVLADLCRGKKGCYSYARVVNCNPKSNGSVAIPYADGRYGLLTIFRHGPRKAGLEFPRGFAETQSLTAEQNIRKELSEELGVPPELCRVTLLGDLQADTGLAAGAASVYLAEFPASAEIRPSEEEGIKGFRWVSEAELKAMIAAGEITDGFTLSAFVKLLCFRELNRQSKGG